jgi:uncharacterized protein YkwD
MRRVSVVVVGMLLTSLFTAGIGGASGSYALSAPPAPSLAADSLLLGGTGELTAATSHAIDRSNRSAVQDAYRQRLVPALATPATFSGNVSTCQPGVESSESRAATLTAVNYYRAMVGLPAVVFDTTYSAKAQAAALIMDANTQLSHYPPSSWQCWTQAGSEGAGNSNLSLGRSGARAIEAYMIDPGANNAAVGHRRWILHPPTRTMGTGSTTRANALWVLDRGTYWNPPPAGMEWVAWPPDGYVPWETAHVQDAGRQLFRWSLSATVGEVDMTGATVRMTLETETLVVTQEPVQSGAIGPTVVWSARRPANLPLPTDKDASVTVSVSGMKRDGATLPTQNYTVRLFMAGNAPTSSLGVPTTVTAAVEKSPIVYGSSTTVTGQVLFDNNGQVTLTTSEVALQRRVRRADGTWTSWTYIDAPHSTSGIGGFQTFTVRPTRTSQFRIRHLGSGNFLPSVSPRVTITVRPKVTATLSSISAPLGTSVTLTGTATPNRAGAVATLQRRRADGTWANLKTTTVSTSSTYRFAIKPGSRGSFVYRVKIDGSMLYANGYSPKRTLTIS